MKLHIRTYGANALVWSDDYDVSSHTVQYDGDYLAYYYDSDIFDNADKAEAEYRSDLTEELKEIFPDAENIEEIVDTIGRGVGAKLYDAYAEEQGKLQDTNNSRNSRNSLER